MRGHRTSLSIGKTAEEIHGDLIAEGLDVTLAEVEGQLDAMRAIGFVRVADLSVGEAVEIMQRDGGSDPAS